ncbi:MAG: aldehyde dehydrogenase family protein, partial [Alphaproteobacteria bacterium]|nr:aldehyde dehydrogenase family protein [Alphaproteobacteria bacterium]
MDESNPGRNLPVDNPLMLIDGKLVESESGRRFASINPANEEELASVPEGSAKDVGRAYEAAAAAQPGWAALSPAERGKYLRDLAAALQEQAERILITEVIDTGNTIAKMRGDVGAAVSQLTYFSGLGYEIKGDTVPATPGNLHMTVREPYGVVGRIIPFNHPIMFAAAKLGPALIAGNTVIEKPSEQSPLSASILAEICAEVLPPGVVNIITGFGHGAGDAIVRHPKIKRVAFIGSVPTGMAIQRSAAEVAVKNITLELGGKNPMIVFPDADMEAAVPAAINGMNFAWQGQSCGSTSRLFLHADIYDDFLEDLVGRVKAMRVGDPLAEDSDMGPINNKGQYEKVLHYIKVGEEDGGRLVAGGRRPEGKAFEKGYWIEPTVFADMTPDMRLANEEVFGPVLSVFKWDDLDRVLEVANSVEYGLTGAVWTRDISTAISTARRIASGY